MFVNDKKVTVCDLFGEDAIRLKLNATDKVSAIKELAEVFRHSKNIYDFDQMLADIIEREALGSTGIGNEVAIPHARSESVREFMIAFARTDGIDFKAPDDKLVKLIFLMVIPKDKGVNDYLKILARLTRLLQRDEFRDALICSCDAKGVITCFQEAEKE